MKIKIGPYTTWWGPYQIADLLRYVGFSEDRCYKIGKWLSSTKLDDLCEWIHSKRKRKLKVHIDDYDVWGMDKTLAIIILPMLKKLKETKHGAPFTKDEDVPELLRSIYATPKNHEYDVDSLHFKRWDWILDEIIWAFEQLQPDCDWEDRYFLVNDDEGYKKHVARISNGLRMFGKYYQSLWD